MCLPYFHDIPTGIFCLLVCCVSLNVLLGNDFKDSIGGMIDSAYTFSFQGFSDEMDYWIDTDGEKAIWYLSSDSVTYNWAIGNLPNLGSNAAYMYSSSYTLEKKCPNNDEGNVWNWWFADYITNSYVETNDVYVKSVNEGNL